MPSSDFVDFSEVYQDLNTLRASLQLKQKSASSAGQLWTDLTETLDAMTSGGRYDKANIGSFVKIASKIEGMLGQLSKSTLENQNCQAFKTLLTNHLIPKISQDDSLKSECILLAQKISGLVRGAEMGYLPIGERILEAGWRGVKGAGTVFGAAAAATAKSALSWYFSGPGRMKAIISMLARQREIDNSVEGARLSLREKGFSEEGVACVGKLLPLIIKFVGDQLRTYNGGKTPPPDLLASFFKKTNGEWSLNTSGAYLLNTLVTQKTSRIITETTEEIRTITGVDENFAKAVSGILEANFLSIVANLGSISIPQDLITLLQKSVADASANIPAGTEGVTPLASHAQDLADLVLKTAFPKAGDSLILPVVGESYMKAPLYAVLRSVLTEALKTKLATLEASLRHIPSPPQKEVKKPTSSAIESEGKLISAQEIHELAGMLGDTILTFLPIPILKKPPAPTGSETVQQANASVSALFGDVLAFISRNLLKAEDFKTQRENAVQGLSTLGIHKESLEVIQKTARQMLISLKQALLTYSNTTETLPEFCQVFFREPARNINGNILHPYQLNDKGRLLVHLLTPDNMDAIAAFFDANFCSILHNICEKCCAGTLKIPRGLFVPGEKLSSEQARKLSEFLLSTCIGKETDLVLPPALESYRSVLFTLLSVPLSAGIQSALAGENLMPATSNPSESTEFQKVSTLLGGPLIAAALGLPPPEAAPQLEPNLVSLAGEIAHLVLSSLLAARHFEQESAPLLRELTGRGLSEQALAYPRKAIQGSLVFIAEQLRKDVHPPLPDFLKPFFLVKSDGTYVLNELGMVLKSMLDPENINAFSLFLETNIYRLLRDSSEQMDKSKQYFFSILQKTLEETDKIVQRKAAKTEEHVSEPRLADFADRLAQLLLLITFPKGAKSLVLPEFMESTQPELFALFSNMILTTLQGTLTNTESSLPSLIELIFSKIAISYPKFIYTLRSLLSERFEQIFAAKAKTPLPPPKSKAREQLVSKMLHTITEEHKAEIEAVTKSLTRLISDTFPELEKIHPISEKLVNHLVSLIISYMQIPTPEVLSCLLEAADRHVNVESVINPPPPIAPSPSPAPLILTETVEQTAERLVHLGSTRLRRQISTARMSEKVVLFGKLGASAAVGMVLPKLITLGKKIGPESRLEEMESSTMDRIQNLISCILQALASDDQAV